MFSGGTEWPIGSPIPGAEGSVDPWKIDVHEDEVRLELGGHRDRVLARFGLAHDLEAVGGLHVKEP